MMSPRLLEYWESLRLHGKRWMVACWEFLRCHVMPSLVACWAFMCRHVKGWMLLFALLLVAPIWAIVRLSAFLEESVLLTGWAFVLLITFLLYARDKRKAETGGWRLNESTLHTFELIGGWPAAFLAQRTLRHKNSKRSYQSTFWTIVGFHQYLALDFVLNWKFARTAVQFVASYVG